MELFKSKVKKTAITAGPTVLLVLVVLFIFNAVRSNVKLQENETMKDSTVETNKVDEFIPPTVGTPAHELFVFSNWLDRNNAKGFIGELGWPDDPEFQEVAREELRVLSGKNIPFTLWATGSSWPATYKLLFFSDSNGDKVLNSTSNQAILTLQQLSIQPGSSSLFGINVSGLEFGANQPSFSAESPGTLGSEYFVEANASFAYLKSQGVKTVRLPFSWERLQPKLYGDLDSAYLSLITDSISAAKTSGLNVILDLHNYARYKPNRSTTLVVGSAELPAKAITDIWTRLNQEISNYADTIYGYGIMNEPYDLPGGSATWENATQEVVSGLRLEGVSAKLIISGYEYSKVKKWEQNHPKGWINDTNDNFLYEAHHYWDADGSGAYN